MLETIFANISLFLPNLDASISCAVCPLYSPANIGAIHIDTSNAVKTERPDDCFKILSYPS